MNFQFTNKRQLWIGVSFILATVLISWLFVSKSYSKWFEEIGEKIAKDSLLNNVSPAPQSSKEISTKSITIEEIADSTLRALIFLKDKSMISLSDVKLNGGAGESMVCSGLGPTDYPGGYFHSAYGSNSKTCKKGETSRSIKVSLDLKTIKVGEIKTTGRDSERHPYNNSAVAGVLTVKYDGNIERFFLLFGSTYRNNSAIIFSESFGEPLNNLIVDNISFEDEVYVVLNAHSPTGQKISIPFLIEGPAYGGDAPRIVKLTSDRKGKIYEDHILSFSYPVSFSTQHRPFSMKSPGQQTRYQDYNLKEVERVSGKSPIYYSGSCGQEPTFSDVNFIFGSKILTAHLPSSTNVYLTTTMGDYVPNEGKIISTLNVTKYVKSIQDGVKIPGKNVDILNIEGYTIRRITNNPTQSGSCSNTSSDQYQWVQDGVLFNMVTSSYILDKLIDPRADQAFVREIIKSVEVK